MVSTKDIVRFVRFSSLCAHDRPLHKLRKRFRCAGFAIDITVGNSAVNGLPIPVVIVERFEGFSKGAFRSAMNCIEKAASQNSIRGVVVRNAIFYHRKKRRFYHKIYPSDWTSDYVKILVEEEF